MSHRIISQSIPVPESIRKQFTHFLLPGEDIASLFHKLDYCVNTEAEGSIWDRKEVQTSFTRCPESIDKFFPHLQTPTKNKVESTNSSCDIENCNAVHNNRETNHGDNEFARSPKTQIENKENSNTNKVTRKRIRKRRNRVFHSTAIEKSLGDSSSSCEFPEAIETFHESSLSDSECSSNAESFNESSPNIKLSRPIIKKFKKGEERDLINENHKTKYKMKENANFKNNSSHKKTHDSADSDSAEINEEPLFKRDSHLKTNIEHNTITKSHDLPGDKNDVALTLGDPEDSIISSNQKISSRSSASKSFKRNSWLNEFKLFLKKKEKSCGGQSTFEDDSSSDNV